MKYLKGFLVSLILSVVIWGVSDLMITRRAINSWVSLSSPPSRVVKLSILSGFYYTIAVESEDGKIYHNYGNTHWLDESDPDIVIAPDDLINDPISNCVIHQPIFIGLYAKNKQIIACRQSYIQYPEVGANLTIVLDQNGEVWQNHEWLGGIVRSKISPFFFVFLLPITFEVFWLILIWIKNTI